MSERCFNGFGTQPAPDGSTATSVCLSVEHDADQGGVLVVASHRLPLPGVPNQMD